MAMDSDRLEPARDFLRHHRIALVGASRDPRAFSRHVMRELLRRGYDVVPVNPSPGEVEGRRCVARVADVAPAVEAALVVTRPEHAADAVRDCVAAGVKDVWFHRGAGAGSASAEALALCARHGLRAVTDLCPFMALPHAGFVHRAHGWLRRARRRRAAA